jgi:hypothetical protein
MQALGIVAFALGYTWFSEARQTQPDPIVGSTAGAFCRVVLLTYYRSVRSPAPTWACSVYFPVPCFSNERKRPP